MKKHNFNAGPSILPRVAIENAAKAILDFEGIGLSLLEISHRTKDFEAVNDEAEALFRELLAVPDNYKILFLGGGASTQFFHVPYNFLEKKAGYVNTGVWAKKAIKEAKNFGQVEVLASSEDKNFTYIPKGFDIPADLDYLHITTNNTIYGTEYKTDIDSPVTLIADMFNPPPVFAISVVKETLKWLKSIGGVAEIQKRNRAKADLLYAEIDRNALFVGTAVKEDRSLMNVCFVMQEQYADLAPEFLEFAKNKGMIGIKGHRLVGGFRASIYNALPIESVQALVDCMQEFEKIHAK